MFFCAKNGVLKLHLWYVEVCEINEQKLFIPAKYGGFARIKYKKCLKNALIIGPYVLGNREF